nr:MAG TPA: major capsid protein [Caudoviricetes sp.]
MAQSATNYAEKYSDQLAQAYLQSSIIAGKTNTEYTFDGNKTVHVYSAVTQPLQDYKRSGTWRYGQPKELEDDVQDLTLKLDKSFSMTIDKGNSKDNAALKRAGTVIKQQIGEQVTPFFDKHALQTWATAAETASKNVITAAPTKDTVVDMFVKARSMFVNQKISMGSNCYAYVPTSTTYAFLLMNPDFISIEKLGDKHLTNGLVGKCMNWNIIEVPDEYLPENTFALFTHKNEVFAPTKIAELKQYSDVPGISGLLIEGRYYGDAFVRKTLVNATTGDPTGTFDLHGVITAKFGG